MRIKFKVQWLKELAKKGGSKINEHSFRGDNEVADLDIERFSPTDLDFILEKCVSDPIPGAKGTTLKIKTYRKLLENPNSISISRLEYLQEAMYKYIKPTPHRWVFHEKSDGMMVPWYVARLKYNKPDPSNGTTASMEMTLSAVLRGEGTVQAVRFDVSDLGGTASAIMQRMGYVLETPEQVEIYEQQMEKHKAVYEQTGKQYLASGIGLPMDRWGHGSVAMVRDNEPSRVVMDDLDRKECEDRRGNSYRRVEHDDFWSMDRKHGEESELDESVVMPVHPYVKVFDLKRHQFVLVHTSNLEEYVYDEKLVNKLILPQKDKDLIQMLISSADHQMEDMIKGKTGGIFVVALGPPGTGKTLTAEVFSEKVRRVLYTVQCSQLGIEADKLEENLQTVLDRAARWGAILLIDEADVYVHARGEDLEQNAIVGVWLRLLEYYRGIMFMTTNRDVTIDDAVMSRATARIRYTYPDKDKLRLIWRVLADQYKVCLTNAQVELLVNNKNWTTLAGRTVKNLLKLAVYQSHANKSTVEVSDLEYVSQFVEMTDAEMPKPVQKA